MWSVVWLIAAHKHTHPWADFGPHHVGRHHGIVDHSMKVGASHTLLLTHTAPTDLTVAAALVRKAYSKRRRGARACVETGESEDEESRVRLHGTGVCIAFVELRYGVVKWYTRAKTVLNMGTI